VKGFRCPVTTLDQPLEWVQIQRHGMHWRQAAYAEIPRQCMEAVGINCRPLDERDDRGKQGTVWIRADQSEQLRAHKHLRLLSEATP
jgi:hypothetical protein